MVKLVYGNGNSQWSLYKSITRIDQLMWNFLGKPFGRDSLFDLLVIYSQYNRDEESQTHQVSRKILRRTGRKQKIKEKKKLWITMELSLFIYFFLSGWHGVHNNWLEAKNKKEHCSFFISHLFHSFSFVPYIYIYILMKKRRYTFETCCLMATHILYIHQEKKTQQLLFHSEDNYSAWIEYFDSTLKGNVYLY